MSAKCNIPILFFCDKFLKKMSDLPTIIREIHAVLMMVGWAEVYSGNMYFII